MKIKDIPSWSFSFLCMLVKDQNSCAHVRIVISWYSMSDMSMIDIISMLLSYAILSTAFLHIEMEHKLWINVIKTCVAF